MNLKSNTEISGIVTALAAGAASAQEILFMCSGDGDEYEVAVSILERFYAENACL